MLKDKRYQDITGIILIFIALFTCVALVYYTESHYTLYTNTGKSSHILGSAGILISHGLRYTFGFASYILAVLIAWLGIHIIRKETAKQSLEKIFSLSFCTVTFSIFMAYFSSKPIYWAGGIVGRYSSSTLVTVLGSTGAGFFTVVLNIIALILLGVLSLSRLSQFSKEGLSMTRSFADSLKKIFPGSKSKDIPLNDIPLNDIDENLNTRKTRFPWIVKKRILVYEKEVNESENRSDMKYLEMKIPEVIKNEFSYLSQAEEVTKEDEEDNIINDAYFDTTRESLKKNNLNPIKLNKSYINDPGEEEIKTPAADRITGIDKEPDMSNKENYEETDPCVFNTTCDDESENLDDDCNDQNNADAEKHSQCGTQVKPSKEYIIPTAFLQSSVPVDSATWKQEIEIKSELLVNTLADFGIEAKVIAVNRGPVITLYELQIAPGIKVTRIVSLSDDIAMALAALRVRIIAPIPGKSAIGVEIPNTHRENVTLGDLIKSDITSKSKGSLNVALGKDILGNPVILDLKSLPHLLIAGATGSGKSVCINSIISSLVYNYGPEYIRFMMVDPKMVELQLYNGLPHLLTPVITNPQHAPNVLKWGVYEMERRYHLLSALNCRDIVKYNSKISQMEDGEKLPFIVIIIDELADLMMVASKEMEGYITRIAQKARAVGIHLVLATQRPSVDVITGIIKANFPARIAFQVAQKTDSRTILDQNGAEKLLGQGDMLYQPPESSFPIRLQGAYISEEEIEEIVKHLSDIEGPQYLDLETILAEQDESIKVEDSGDELFTEALKIVEETRKASASYLQRRLSIGYNRAARMIEEMEDLGYIGPQQGSKPREVFI